MHWYVVNTKPHSEHRVERHLINQNIEVFLPLYKCLQTRNGSCRETIKPLFRNYLFAKFDVYTEYCKIIWTRGVRKVLGAKGKPIPISDTVVEAIKERVNSCGLVELLDDFKEGDIVEIVSGPLEGIRALFLRHLSDGERVKILISLLGREIPVDILRWHVRHA